MNKEDKIVVAVTLRFIITLLMIIIQILSDKAFNDLLSSRQSYYDLLDRWSK